MVSRKRMRLIIAILIVTALAVLVLVIMNFKNRDGAINAADAMIEELLKCTAEDADTIVETLRLSVEDDTQLRDLFTARYGSLATDECISNLISNRAVLYSVTLAQKYESDIDVSNVKLKKTSESSEVYAFSADLIALKSNENIAHVTGTIVMEKMPTGWIAKRISLNN